MRFAVKTVLVLTLLAVLAVGLLPPVFAGASLRDDASSGAQAGFAALLAHGSTTASVDVAVEHAVGRHRGVRIDSIKVRSNVVTVVLTENVHSFMDRLPGLRSWFRITVTESATTPFQ